MTAVRPTGPEKPKEPGLDLREAFRVAGVSTDEAVFVVTMPSTAGPALLVYRASPFCR